MSKWLAEIKKRSNNYISNLDANVIRMVEGNREFIIQQNQRQFAGHKDSKGNALIHKSTGSTKLSSSYAKKTGKKRPDFFVSGDFWDKMLFFMPSAKEYIITSSSFLAKFLVGNYGSIFGVSPKNQPRTRTINDNAVLRDYFNAVFK